MPRSARWRAEVGGESTNVLAAALARFADVMTLEDLGTASSAMRNQRRCLTFVEMMTEQGEARRRARDEYGLEVDDLMRELDSKHPTTAALLYVANVDHHPEVVMAVARALGHRRADRG